jgi:hypothetical protein
MTTRMHLQWLCVLAACAPVWGCYGVHGPEATPEAVEAPQGPQGDPVEACLPAYHDARLEGLPCAVEITGWWRGDADCCGGGAVVWPPDLVDRYGPDTACTIVEVLTGGTGEVCPPWWLAEGDDS